MPRAVLFDLFDTLIAVSTSERWHQMFADIAGVLEVDAERFGAEWSLGFERRMVGAVRHVEAQIEEVLDGLGETRDAECISRAADLKRVRLAGILEPKDDAVHTLDALQSRGVALGLVTDCSWETPAILEGKAITPYFSARACSAHLGFRKPDPCMYEHVIRALDIPAQDCLYVGDGNSHELSGARKLGMTTVWVDNGDGQHFKERWSPDGDHTVRELTELVELVDRLRD